MWYTKDISKPEYLEDLLRNKKNLDHSCFTVTCKYSYMCTHIKTRLKNERILLTALSE